MVFINYIIQVQFDYGVLVLLQQECDCLGIKKLLVVIDLGICNVGLLDKVLGQLKDGVGIVVYDQILFNFNEGVVCVVVVLFCEYGCDGIVVVGGGFFIDLVKGVVVCGIYEGLLKFFVFIEGGLVNIMVKIVLVIVILIIVGIGSEVGCGVILIFDDGCKVGIILLYLVFKLVFCDFEFILGLLLLMMVVIGMDVIVYCLEIFMVFVFNLFVDGIVLDGLWCVWVYIECVMCELGDCEVWLNMMSVFMQGVMVFQKGLGCVYSLLYLLGGINFKLYYGILNVIFLLVIIVFNESVFSMVKDNKMVCMVYVMGLVSGVGIGLVICDMSCCLGLLVGLCELGVSEFLFLQIIKGVLVDYSYKINLCEVLEQDYLNMLQ